MAACQGGCHHAPPGKASMNCGRPCSRPGRGRPPAHNALRLAPSAPPSRMQAWFDKQIKGLGVQNAYFPMFITEDVLNTGERGSQQAGNHDELPAQRTAGRGALTPAAGGAAAWQQLAPDARAGWPGGCRALGARPRQVGPAHLSPRPASRPPASLLQRRTMWRALPRRWPGSPRPATRRWRSPLPSAPPARRCAMARPAAA